MDPPQCVQNAMMTKDKKPFTYTPGGIDLSEVRSPSMQRRIERNANLGGVDEFPKQQAPHPQNYGPLPPSALAAMRPQPQVQVFPSGPAPPAPMRGGAPPPPPPMCNIPPPPPPPSGPLPTQKVTTADNVVLDRPDMTKIIPDNPMALLRKTGGPAPRKSIVDELFDQPPRSAPGPRSPPAQSARVPQFEQEQQRYQPPIVERGAPVPPVPQQHHTYQPPAQQYQPVKQQYQPPQQQRSPEIEQELPRYQPQAPYQPPKQQYQPPVQEQPRYQPPVIERKPAPPRQQHEDPELKTSTAHLGSLYIPPATQQQQRRIMTPPSPPERNVDSPSIQTPPLREAPKPWAQKKAQQEELPPWAKRENEVEERQKAYTVQSPPEQIQQQRWPQSKPAQQPVANQQQYSPQPSYSQQPIGVRIEIRTRDPEEEVEVRNPNAVYITQPLVFQHPGPVQPNKQKQPQLKVDSQGAKIIPVQVDGSKTPSSAGSDRSLNRQQSWGNNPPQSNSFKVIQKITQTDDDEEDVNTPITSHSPKFPQNFQQPPDQMRKMSDQNVNRFKQVPSGPQPQSKTPHVRTIPIQIEDDTPQQYVHPSEQVVPEPKKYTGSSIPSRSFKILQAMTAAPDNCANVNDQNEAYEQWAYNPHYPPYPPPPYWHEYYHNYYYPEPASGLPKDDSAEKIRKSTPRQTPTPTPRQTPVPFWGYTPSYPKHRKTPTTELESDSETVANPRATPVPSWGYEYQPTEDYGDAYADYENYPPYPPYYDPYYYHYYYGYHPGYPPYPYYGTSDTEEYAGYSSMDEMSQYHKSRNNSRVKEVKRGVTPTLCVKEQVLHLKEQDQDTENESLFTESDTEDEDLDQKQPFNPLKSIRSVNNIQIYCTNEDDSEDGICIEEGSDGSNEEEFEEEEGSVYVCEEDCYPHQLSVIMEESERTDSRIRSVSVMSDSTTIADKSDVEDEEPQLATLKLPSRMPFKVSEEYVGIEHVQISDDTEEAYTSFTVKSCSSTPKQRSPCREDEYEEAEEEIEEEDKKSNESEDWWGILGNEDDMPTPKRSIPMEIEKNVTEENYIKEENGVENTETTVSDVKNNMPAPKKSIPVEIKKNMMGENHIKEENGVENTETTVSDVKDNMPAPKKSIPVEIKKNMIGENHIKEENGVENTETTVSDVKNTVIVQDTVVVLRRKKNTEDNTDKRGSYNRKSVYDSSSEEEEDETSGKLMSVDSFVKQLEEIKRNSGLFNIDLRNIRNTNTDGEKSGNKEKAKEQDISEGNAFWSTNKNEGDIALKRKSLARENSDESSANYSQYNCSESISSKSESGSCVLQNQRRENRDNNLYHDTNEDKSDTEDSSDMASSSSEDESEDCPKQNDTNNNESNDVKVPSIQERIDALKEAIKQKQSKIMGQEPKMSVKEKVSTVERNGQARSKTTSAKSSLKSFEEFSEEEEVDSGVTSDMSRHISDTEEFPELKKLTRYQRAATHSRLFKLLQEECENEDIGEGAYETSNCDQDKFAKLSIRQGTRDLGGSPRRDLLSLPLNRSTESDSICSSGLSSPNFTVNEKLVEELVQSLLKRKKGKAFRSMPKEKLYAAAARILQEDIDVWETPSDYGSFLSPLRSSTGYSTAAQTPQEFSSNYEEYKQYYDSWNDPDHGDHNFDMLPSKTLRLLQESNLNKSGAIAGLIAKCPRVLSSKSIHKKLIKLLERPESPSPTPKKPLDTNEVTTAS